MNIKNEEMNGTRQSPIDIQTRIVKRSADDPDRNSLKIDYSPLKGVSMSIENTGHGWQLNIPDQYAQECPITGGHLRNDHYRLLQIHAHWGKNCSNGSEHTINGKSYPSEIHLVHWNVSKYSTPIEAQNNSKDGLAVIGVFVQLCQTPHPILTMIDSLLPSIPFKGDKKMVQNGEMDLNLLIPDRHSPNYWFYLGSLTTPPFSESVLWFVMKTPIRASESQIVAFRQLYSRERNEHSNHLVDENFRDVQDRNNRAIVDVNYD
ncbi:glycosyl transferase [Sarcoptes scabiei]|uniref:Carbonic anhydrase n=1 Tax=Sarcoptes scabiei TaxID=52283 RepID=A0A131ZUP1_SARSC|nr:Eukaryotic-type carbonic anhydrase-like protein [Sarcoptes scabiei]UXI20515.1 glycosyl transferase [Sarcoptes scabiei]